jgi:Glycosyl transferase family 2
MATPVGAYHRLLPCSLESLRLQTEPMDLAFLDASGDPRVEQIADVYGDLIRYRRHGPDGGQAAAICEGWAQSDAEILGWLNADDLLFPGALSTVARLFEAHPEVDVVYGHSAICDERMCMTGYHWAVSPPGPSLRLGCNISQPSCFFRRAAYEAAGGLDGHLHYTMDWDLWLRFDDQGSRFLFVEEPLSAVFWGKGTKTSGFNAARRRELSRLIRRYTPVAERRRVFRGFAVQSALEHLPTRTLQRLTRATLFRNQQRVFGVGPDGRLDCTATIAWFHLESAPQDHLVLELSGRGSVELSTSRAVTRIDRTATSLVVQFAEAVEAGVVVSVNLHTTPGPPTRFCSCSWQA